ncbi:hypothetical protein DPEC_G00111390 [Dallia pectoralis]|uniref:Uncharacterized protein n=1 Tax=Dallia pectoralis TaxID=75939 RepID=A0ACC2GSX3_DALPE|nr:hypothetical protein DPEC_G00111390 [Dallia pectoralis]
MWHICLKYICFSLSNYAALIGVWIYGFFVMVLLALDFLYYSAMNYELCRVYLERWGLGGQWLKQARSQWHARTQAQDRDQSQGQRSAEAPGPHHHHRHSRHSFRGERGEAQSPVLHSFQISTA